MLYMALKQSSTDFASCHLGTACCTSFVLLDLEGPVRDPSVGGGAAPLIFRQLRIGHSSRELVVGEQEAASKPDRNHPDILEGHRLPLLHLLDEGVVQGVQHLQLMNCSTSPKLVSCSDCSSSRGPCWSFWPPCRWPQTNWSSAAGLCLPAGHPLHQG